MKWFWMIFLTGFQTNFQPNFQTDFQKNFWIDFQTYIWLDLQRLFKSSVIWRQNDKKTIGILTSWPINIMEFWKTKILLTFLQPFNINFSAFQHFNKPFTPFHLFPKFDAMTFFLSIRCPWYLSWKCNAYQVFRCTSVPFLLFPYLLRHEKMPTNRFLSCCTTTWNLCIWFEAAIEGVESEMNIGSN